MAEHWIPPQLVSRAGSAPAGEDWLHEIKYDGYRLSARRDGQVCLYTRNGHDWTAHLPEIASAMQSLPACYLDGELVAVDSQGVPTFEALQRALRRQPGQRPLYFQVFDLLELDGRRLTGLPLLERKAHLRELLRGSPDRLRYVDHVRGNGSAVFARADALELEGIVSKRAGIRYQMGLRSGQWLKTKCWRFLRFPVVGYTVTAHRLESLLLASDGGEGPSYAGRVEYGLAHFPGLFEVLFEAQTAHSPFGRGVRGAHWIRPGVAAEVQCLPWSRGRKIRHAVLRGLHPQERAA
jgi:bifunctional non-homologous end joining protein LigD